jgi:hypothetical protein
VVRTLRLFKRHHMNMLHVVLAALVLTWLGFQLFAPPLHPVKPCDTELFRRYAGFRLWAEAADGGTNQCPGLVSGVVAVASGEVDERAEWRAAF